MSGTSLDFHAYLQPRAITSQWWMDLLRILWQHGLRFTQQTPDALTWEAELRATGHLIVGPDGRQIHGSLRDGIDRIVAGDATGLAVWDHGAEFGLDLYPTDFPKHGPAASALPSPPLMRVMLSMATDRSSPPTARPANWADPREIDAAPLTLVPGYLQKRLALLHWSSLLCEQLNPIYGIGYDSEHDVVNDLIRFREHIQQSLSEGHLPDVRTYLRDQCVQYVSPVHATAERIQAFLAGPGWTLRRLTGGGIFVMAPGEPFSYERGAANRQMSLANQARAVGLRASSPESGNEAAWRVEMLEHYRRALEIYRAGGDTAGVQAMRAYLPPEDLNTPPPSTGQ